MGSEEKICQNCKKNFTIQQDDFSFYEKMQVPPPKWCRECRQMRRMNFCNERNLYKRKSDKTGKDIISVYSPNSPHKVFEYAFWFSDKFDPMEYGREYDFSKSFIEQMGKFMILMPWPSLRIQNCENCDYNNDMGNCKDCYLSTRTQNSTNVLYGYRVGASRDCVDCMQVIRSSEFLYECIECISCNHSRFLSFCENCSNSNMLLSCTNCLDCFMCVNLRNKQYCFKNQQLSREEYKNKIANFNSGSFKEQEQTIRKFYDFCLKNIRKNLSIINSNNVSGDNIVDSRNAFMCFGIKFCENVRYLWDLQKHKDSMDSYRGGRDSELIYECVATGGSYNCRFSYNLTDCGDVSYSINVKNSKNIFACIGLENKEFCIFNRQYSKEEYETQVGKIIDQMKKEDEYGEFFPLGLSMFAYNETVAQEYFSMTKEETLKKSLRWQDPDTKNYSITLKSQELPDDIKYIEENILNQSIGCAHSGNCSHGCTTAFRIISRELEFYIRMKIPIPRLCPNCRHYGRVGKLNPLKLWNRKCQCAGTKSENGVYKNLVKHHLHADKICPNRFETSYSPNHPEIVYCENCYKQEVY